MWGDPMELEYLAAAVPDHMVEILDMRVDDDLQTRLEKFRPGLVGVTANTCDVPMALQALREVKKFDAGIVTAVGGHHATFLPADFAEPSVDAIFLGMADISFRDFVSRLEDGKDLSEVHNLALVWNGRLEFTEPESFEMDLDRIPFPARHLVVSRKEFYRQLVHLYALTYGFRRYFRSLLGDLLSRLKKNGKPPESVDRLSFPKLCILHLVAFPLLLKVLRIHKAEPLVRPAAGNVV
jgi:radical SAM superfamily enzyme YgiQ (UPF0313 family)